MKHELCWGANLESRFAVHSQTVWRQQRTWCRPGTPPSPKWNNKEVRERAIRIESEKGEDWITPAKL